MLIYCRFNVIADIKASKSRAITQWQLQLTLDDLNQPNSK